ncbi:MAG TPA: glutamate--tRNA ligase, partial [Burkholderiales bacterium]|nr:glutamate--tRNA ligase [Burkholderiales bacterium]
SRSPAQFNPEKLAWISQQYLKSASPDRLAPLVEPELRKRGVDTSRVKLLSVINLVKDRASTLSQLADEAMLFYAYAKPNAVPLEKGVKESLQALKTGLQAVEWERGRIGELIKNILKAQGLKMPQLAMPLRQIVTGRAQTPSIDAVLELLGRDTVLLRLGQFLEAD